MDPEVLRRYVEMLGLERWVRRWTAANGELAERVGLVEAAAKPPKPRKRGAPTS